jgi:hypothetical protein
LRPRALELSDLLPELLLRLALVLAGDSFFPPSGSLSRHPVVEGLGDVVLAADVADAAIAANAAIAAEPCHDDLALLLGRDFRYLRCSANSISSVERTIVGRPAEGLVAPRGSS